MIELLLEVLVEFLFEFLLSFFAEVIVEIFGAATAKLILPDALKQRVKQVNPLFMLPAFACFGVGIGVLSIWLFPAHFITSPRLQQMNLVLTPIFVGISSALGSSLTTGGQSQSEVLRHAAQGFLFALALVLTRYFMAI
jgi:hypothetical protein